MHLGDTFQLCFYQTNIYVYYPTNTNTYWLHINYQLDALIIIYS